MREDFEAGREFRPALICRYAVGPDEPAEVNAVRSPSMLRKASNRSAADSSMVQRQLRDVLREDAQELLLATGGRSA